eukprot:2212524-Rhodomonas_salina.2
MVKVVDYGSLPSRPIPAATRKSTAASFAAVAGIAVSTLAVVLYLNNGASQVSSELLPGSVFGVRL